MNPIANNQTAAIAAAFGGLAATIVTGVACVGPLVAILLGIGGFGWLTQYGFLRVPATVATALFLAFGFYFVYVRNKACARTRKGRLSRVILWSATALAVAVNTFEYFILPNLG